MAHSQEKKQSIESVPEEAPGIRLPSQKLDISHFNMLKDLKETIDKEMKKNQKNHVEKLKNIYKELPTYRIK